MNDQNITVVTGANRGIGLEFCRALKAAGKSVLAVCRNESPELKELGVETLLGCDLTQDVGRKNLISKLQQHKIATLIHNAGVYASSDDAEGMLLDFTVNALAPIEITQGLASNLQEGAKVAFISSRMGSIADNGSGGAYAYRMSKAALNAGVKSLSIDLASKGIAIALFHPGWVRTEMTSGKGKIDAPESVSGILKHLESVEPGSDLVFRHTNGVTLPW